MYLQTHLPSFFNEERAESADVACTKHNSVEKSDKGGVDVILWKKMRKVVSRSRLLVPSDGIEPMTLSRSTC